MTVTDQEIVEQLEVYGRQPAEILPVGQSATDLPSPWRPIAAAEQAPARIESALGLWNEAFLAMIPRTAELFRTELVDVRVARRDGEYLLLYIVEHYPDTPHREVRVWVGGQPDPGGAVPELWDCVPAALREFLQTVHGGLTAADREAFGPQAPRYLQTLAEIAGAPDGIPGWDYEPDSTRLLLIATDGGADCCVSPDLPEGEGVLIYQGDEPDPPQPVGLLLDEIIDATL
ncbi:hypothetical protein [Jongsikchunia kroppenstedtii]|uniref:hypothetical protein n=1 Tax=Jongsikchunia kroppenstedtii TaxID=1121721 RepID=UPI000367CBA5|nr:hypothetical protein [Jongsikchunia kroppenstedtii]